MKYCGIILAKKNSNRLPNKNFLEIKGDWMVYEMSVNALIDSGIYVYVFSDNFTTKFMGFNNYISPIKHEIIRPPAASLDNEPIFSALKWAYKSLPKRYDAVICIMANCPQHTPEGVKKAIERFEDLGCDELRSFNKDGSESGLMIFKEKYLLEKHEISTYQAAIELESIEIHTKEDFEKAKQMMK